MALTERSRSALYRGLTDLIEDEVAVGELLSYFPARDAEEPATKEFVAARTSEVRAELAVLRADFSDLRADLAAMESRLTAQAAAQLRTSIQWTLGALVSVIGLVVAMGLLQGP